jgi:hypothetical protein
MQVKLTGGTTDETAQRLLRSRSFPGGASSLTNPGSPMIGQLKFSTLN